MISNLSHITLILLTLWIGAKGFTVYYQEKLFQIYYKNWLGGTHNEQPNRIK